MLWIMVLGAACVVLGIFNAVWGFVEALMLRRARRAPAKAEGVVCGLVRHRLPMRYEKQGDVLQLPEWRENFKAVLGDWCQSGVPVLGPHYSQRCTWLSQYPAGDDAVELVPLRPVHRERRGD